MIQEFQFQLWLFRMMYLDFFVEFLIGFSDLNLSLFYVIDNFILLCLDGNYNSIVMVFVNLNLFYFVKLNVSYDVSINNLLCVFVVMLDFVEQKVIVFSSQLVIFFGGFIVNGIYRMFLLNFVVLQFIFVIYNFMRW